MKENQEKWIKIVLGVICAMCVTLAVSTSCGGEGGKIAWNGAFSAQSQNQTVSTFTPVC